MRAARAALERLRPLYVLAPLALLQWSLVLGLALHAPHNGWLFFHGGDATQYWSHEWALAHGWLPQTVLGYGVPVFFAWVPLLFGETLLGGLPAIMLVQVLVLGTVALVCVYGIGSRLSGRLFGYWTALLWAIAPVAAIPLFRADYHDRYVGQILPQALGLTNLGDFPSMAVLLAAAYFAFRAIDDGRGNDAVLAGLLVGLAVGVKPANALVLPVPVVALALARRWRQIPLFAVALVPALLTLALWKERGLGHLPLLSVPEVREAAGSLGSSVPGADRLGHYLNFSRSRFDYNLGQLREFFWSRLLCEFLVVAGAYAAIRKSTPKGVYLLAWFLAIVVVKGGSPVADVKTGSFFRLTMPGFPAFLLLAASVVLLVPGWGRRVARVRLPETGPRRTRGLAAAVVLLAVLPLVVVAAASPAPPGKLARNLNTIIETPISNGLELTIQHIRDGVRIRWPKPETSSAKVFYIVYRNEGGDGCNVFPTGGARECLLQMQPLGQTDIRWLDDTPLPGTYVYRVGMAAAPTGLPSAADLMLLSPPARATVRCTTAKCRADVKKLRAVATP
jgi:hypothetical protein